jgi:hypothetical protein
VNYSFRVIYYYGRFKGKIGTSKDEGSYYGYVQQGIGSYKASRVFIICLQPHSSHKMQPMDKAFMGNFENISLPRNLKMTPFKPMVIRHRLPNWQTVRKIQASCNRRDSG